MDKLTVYIPTRRRIQQQTTMAEFFLREIVKEGLHWLDFRFVVPLAEKKEFLVAHPWTKRILAAVGSRYKFGSVCQNLLDRSDGWFLILDDDMVLLRRRNRLNVSQRGGRGTIEDSMAFFARIRHWLVKGYAHGGVSLRQTNHYCQGQYYRVNTRVSGATFYDAQILKKKGIRFDAVQARSDFHVCLSLLEQGYKNVCDYEFICGQVGGGSNAAGGCSTYRTPEFQLEQAKLLKELHPDAVSLVYKTRKGENLNKLATAQGIPDVRIAWKKSFHPKEGR
jgi:hypothetical protein